MSLHGPRSEKDKKLQAQKSPKYVELYSYTQDLGELASLKSLQKLRAVVDSGESDLNKKKHSEIVEMAKHALKVFNYHFFSVDDGLLHSGKPIDERFLQEDEEPFSAFMKIYSQVEKFYTTYGSSFGIREPQKILKSLLSPEDKERSADFLVFWFNNICFEAIKNSYDSVMLRNYLSTFTKDELLKAHPLTYKAVKKYNKGRYTAVSAVSRISFRAEYAFEEGISYLRITDNGVGPEILNAFKAQHCMSFRNHSQMMSTLSDDDIFGGVGVFAKLGLRTGGAGLGQKIADLQLERFRGVKACTLQATIQTNPIHLGVVINYKGKGFRFKESVSELLKGVRHVNRHVGPTGPVIDDGSRADKSKIIYLSDSDVESSETEEASSISLSDKFNGLNIKSVSGEEAGLESLSPAPKHILHRLDLSIAVASSEPWILKSNRESIDISGSGVCDVDGSAKNSKPMKKL